jgi:hypothetical protein
VESEASQSQTEDEYTSDDGEDGWIAFVDSDLELSDVDSKIYLSFMLGLV